MFTQPANNEEILSKLNESERKSFLEGEKLNFDPSSPPKSMFDIRLEKFEKQLSEMEAKLSELQTTLNNLQKPAETKKEK